MAKKPPPAAREEVAVVSVDGMREKTIALLSQHFAQDNLSLDELEKRIEAAYRATTVPALQDLTRDLVGNAPSAPAAAGAVPARRAAPDFGGLEYAAEHDRIVAFMSSTRRKGVWRPARRTVLWAIMSETVLDLTQAVLPPGITEIRVRGLMSSAKVIVPPGVRVVIQPDSIMSSVSDETMEPPAVGSGAPVVRLTGTLLMCEMRAVVRRRELGAGQARDEDEADE